MNFVVEFLNSPWWALYLGIGSIVCIFGTHYSEKVNFFSLVFTLILWPVIVVLGVVFALFDKPKK